MGDRLVAPAAGGSEIIFHDGRLRLQITPQGTLKGVVTGYQDWRRVLMYAAASNQEKLYDLTVPGLYSALRREADGMKDPATGQCMGISSVFDIEGTRAFMSSAPSKFVMAQGNSLRCRPGEPARSGGARRSLMAGGPALRPIRRARRA